MDREHASCSSVRKEEQGINVTGFRVCVWHEGKKDVGHTGMMG
jgi:hypothetical protein